MFLGVDGVKWHDWVDTSSHLEAVGNLAAHVHITTAELLRKGSYSTAPGLTGNSISELVSPQTFIDCLKMTKTLAMEIKKKEQVCTLLTEYKNINNSYGHVILVNNLCECIIILWSYIIIRK